MWPTATQDNTESLAWSDSTDAFVQDCRKVVLTELNSWANRPQTSGQVPLLEVVVTGGDYAARRLSDVFGFTLLAGRRVGGRNPRRKVCGSIVSSPNESGDHTQYVCCGLSDGRSFEVFPTPGKDCSWDLFQSGMKLGSVRGDDGSGKSPTWKSRKVAWTVDIDGRFNGTIDRSSKQSNVFILRTDSGEEFPIRIWDPSSIVRTFRFVCWVASGMWLFKDFVASEPMLDGAIEPRLSSGEREQLFALSILFRFLIYFQNPIPPGG